MGRISATAFDRQRARIWSRYLCKSLDCDVRWLDRTLLMPPTGRVEVLSNRQAPKVFHEIHAQGRNPNGAYWMDLNDNGRFNLFERVCIRVPASRMWLLEDFLSYTKEDPPSIAKSHGHLTTFLEQREVRFLRASIGSILKNRHPLLYKYLVRQGVSCLAVAATPETLLFLTAFLHEHVWTRKGRKVKEIRGIAEQAALLFCAALIARKFEDAEVLADETFDVLSLALATITHLGDRSPPSLRPNLLYDLPKMPLLVQDTAEVQLACNCLVAAAGNPVERILLARSLGHEGYLDANLSPPEDQIRSAVRTIAASVLEVHRRIATEYERSLFHLTPAAVFTRPTARKERYDPRRTSARLALNVRTRSRY